MQGLGVVNGDGLFLCQWDAVENKSTVLTYAGGAIVAVWLSSVIVGAVNSVPLVRPRFAAHICMGRVD